MATAIMRVISGPLCFKIVVFARLTPIPFGLQNTIFAVSTYFFWQKVFVSIGFFTQSLKYLCKIRLSIVQSNLMLNLHVRQSIIKRKYVGRTLLALRFLKSENNFFLSTFAKFKRYHCFQCSFISTSRLTWSPRPDFFLSWFWTFNVIFVTSKVNPMFSGWNLYLNNFHLKLLWLTQRHFIRCLTHFLYLSIGFCLNSLINTLNVFLPHYNFANWIVFRTSFPALFFKSIGHISHIT